MENNDRGLLRAAPADTRLQTGPGQVHPTRPGAAQPETPQGPQAGGERPLRRTHGLSEAQKLLAALALKRRRPRRPVQEEKRQEELQESDLEEEGAAASAMVSETAAELGAQTPDPEPEHFPTQKIPFKGYRSRWGDSGFYYKSGQKLPSFKSIELKDDNPQAIKQEFVKVRQKVDALLSCLEKGPDPEAAEKAKGAEGGGSQATLTDLNLKTDDSSSSSSISSSNGNWA
ncbi:uncharacterized protein LOC116420218 [Sarcophilus harrisii]|uniref:uncharacterized protein LOC116420218 n=1 Tax=Sarcophilus harrisii TaxID=9305 RepID=UPI001301AFE2|nr:uncharacterized protein LOC116420218 [Sarcophilus harrisii]